MPLPLRCPACGFGWPNQGQGRFFAVDIQAMVTAAGDIWHVQPLDAEASQARTICPACDLQGPLSAYQLAAWEAERAAAGVG